VSTLARPGSGRPRHVLGELGFAIRRAGDELHGSADLTEHVLVPGAPHLRTSVLAIWADTLAGLLAALAVGPRVPVTLDLTVQLHAPAPGSGPVRAFGRTLRAGRTVIVAEVDFHAGGQAEPFAVATAAFMTAHDPALRLPDELSIDAPASAVRLAAPLAERAACRRDEPGRVVLDRTEDGLNAAKTMNGGLLALAAEEAALSLAPPGSTLETLGLRYLQPARIGPAVAVATRRGGLGRVEVRDTGNGDRLCVLATTRERSPVP
jgi:acyl-coenzyme A thioesterase PaaI-like protein